MCVVLMDKENKSNTGDKSEGKNQLQINAVVSWCTAIVGWTMLLGFGPNTTGILSS